MEFILLLAAIGLILAGLGLLDAVTAKIADAFRNAMDRWHL